MPPATPQLDWKRQHFHAGERVAVAVSGGADSVALLLAMAASRAEAGLVLSAVHVHHGLRGKEADDDAQFVTDLAARLELALHIEHGDVGALADQRGQGIEEAARVLRYRVFHELLNSRTVDAIATAHTMDDQTETVLMKMLRGAWTEGLGGIAPVVTTMDGPRSQGRIDPSCSGRNDAPVCGHIIRPLLEVSRAEVVAYLEALGQPWREDSTNREPAFTRNRIRHTLLPQLRDFQPRIAEQLSRMATVARDEEAWWQCELARVLPGLVLPGKPVRGGGRANSTQPGESVVAIELERLRALHPALERRVLRAAMAQLGSTLTFDQTESLLALANSIERMTGKRGRVELGAGLVAERTARELRLERSWGRGQDGDPLSGPSKARLAEQVLSVPGTIEIPELGYRFTTRGMLFGEATLLLRGPRPGDQVHLRHSRGVKTVKEVLERRGLNAAERVDWPVLAVGSRIVWMKDFAVEGQDGLQIEVEALGQTSAHPVRSAEVDAT